MRVSMQVAPLWRDLGCRFRTVVVIKAVARLRPFSSYDHRATGTRMTSEVGKRHELDAVGGQFESYLTAGCVCTSSSRPTTRTPTPRSLWQRANGVISDIMMLRAYANGRKYDLDSHLTPAEFFPSTIPPRRSVTTGRLSSTAAHTAV